MNSMEVYIVDEKQRQAAIDVMIPAVRDLIKSAASAAGGEIGIEDRALDEMIRETLLGLDENASANDVAEAMKGRIERFLSEAETEESVQDEQSAEVTEVESEETEKPQPPVLSLRQVGENKKKGTVRVALVLEGDPVDYNLFGNIQATGGSDSLVARRINADSNESHPISVPIGHDIRLELLTYNKCNFSADVRKQVKAPKKIPIYKIGEKHLHIA